MSEYLSITTVIGYASKAISMSNPYIDPYIVCLSEALELPQSAYQTGSPAQSED